MANYYVTGRTNYFKVNDVEKLKKLAAKIPTEDGEAIVIEGDKNTYAIAGFGVLSQYYDEELDDFVDIHEKIQELLPDGEACIIIEIGNEKLTYLNAAADIITNKKVVCINLYQYASQMARKLLDDDKKEFKYTSLTDESSFH